MLGFRNVLENSELKVASNQQGYSHDCDQKTKSEDAEKPQKHLGRTPETIVGKGVVHIAPEGEQLLLLNSGQLIEIGLVVGYEG